MISLVIPTMWRYKPFLNFLNTIVELNCIGEVILINNNIDHTPKHSVLDHPKLKIQNFPSNIFINPAWNLGAEVAIYENLCVMNDDVIVDLKVFIEADRFLTNRTENNERSMLLIVPGDGPPKIRIQQIPVTDGTIDIIPFDQSFTHPDLTYGWGTLFFMPTSQWIRIPNTMRVFYGDNWVFESQVYLSDTIPYCITNCFYFSPYNVTWKGDNTLEGVIAEDKIEWDKIDNEVFVPLRANGIWWDRL